MLSFVSQMHDEDCATGRGHVGGGGYMLLADLVILNMTRATIEEVELFG